MDSQMAREGSASHATAEVVDAVVVGAGISGIYQLYRLLEDGLTVKAFEAADGVGGVWFWNRYPGARVDSHFPHYQFWFSKALWEESNWTERFPAQPEIEAYFNRVVDRFDLRRHITFGTRVTSAKYDEESATWTVRTDQGEVVRTRFLIFNTGGLSQPVTPAFSALERFQGQTVHTSRWPREGVPLAGKRVAVVGTAATGIQVIQTIAPTVAQLTVFQRTPNYAVSMHNPKITEDDLAWMRSAYDDLYPSVHASLGGFHFDDGDPPLYDDLSPAEREARLESLWSHGDLRIWAGTFADGLFNPEAAECISDFARRKIREQVSDTRTAEKLMPRDHYFGTRRVPLENGYFRTFDRDNVELVDLRETPLESFDETGAKTSTAHYAFDVLIFATGFEAGTGALDQIDIRGLRGASLRETWQERLRTTLGMQVHGFPNLFMTMAPFAPSATHCNVPVCSDQQCNWIADAIAFVREQGKAWLQPSRETEAWWMATHQQSLESHLMAQNPASWYHRVERDGTDTVLGYQGGIDEYRRVCDELRAGGFRGFELG